MQALKLPASAGFDWLKQGFGIFKSRPSLFLALAFIWNLNAVLSIGLLGFLGVFSIAVVQPVFLAFVMQCCDRVNNTKPLRWSELFAPFEELEILKPLLVAGLIYAIIFFLFDVLLTPEIINQSVLEQAIAQNPQIESGTEYYALVLQAVSLGGILMTFLQQILLTVLFWFAPALLLWHRLSAIKAIVFSCVGVGRNLAAFFVLAIGVILCVFVIWFVAIVVVSVGLPFNFVAFLIQIIFLSLLMCIYCAMYISYKQIYQND